MSKDISVETFSRKNVWWSFFFFQFQFQFLPLIGSSYSLVSSLQLQRRGEGREPCVLRNTTQPSHTASWHDAHPTQKPVAPMCRRKHRTPGDLVSMQCARPATGVASAWWDKDIPDGQTLPNPDDAGLIVRRPMDLPVAGSCNRAWARTQNLWWHSLRPLHHPGGLGDHSLNVSWMLSSWECSRFVVDQI